MRDLKKNALDEYAEVIQIEQKLLEDCCKSHSRRHGTDPKSSETLTAIQPEYNE